MNLNIPIPSEVQQDLRAMISELARDVIQEVREKEAEFPCYMTVKETQEYMRCSFGTLQKYEQQKGLRSIRIEGKKLFRKEAVDEFLRTFEK